VWQHGSGSVYLQSTEFVEEVSQVGLCKIFYSFTFKLLRGSPSSVYCPATCKAYTIAILVHDYRKIRLILLAHGARLVASLGDGS